jgi:hypothetical protein
LKAFEDLYEHNVKPILTELQVLDCIREDHLKGTDVMLSSCVQQPYFSSSSMNVADKADFFVQCHVPAAYQQLVSSYDQLRTSTPHVGIGLVYGCILYILIVQVHRILGLTNSN